MPKVYEYCFTSLSAQSWQYRDRRKPEAGTMLYAYFEWLHGLFIVHSSIGSTVHSRPLNSLEHCICTTTMTNIRSVRDSNLVPPDYKPQSIRMSLRGQPACLTAVSMVIMVSLACLTVVIMVNIMVNMACLTMVTMVIMVSLACLTVVSMVIMVNMACLTMVIMVIMVNTAKLLCVLSAIIRFSEAITS